MTTAAPLQVELHDDSIVLRSRRAHVFLRRHPLDSIDWFLDEPAATLPPALQTHVRQRSSARSLLFDAADDTDKAASEPAAQASRKRFYRVEVAKKHKIPLRCRSPVRDAQSRRARRCSAACQHVL